MNEKLCFVQFMHPGGEHRPDEPGLKRWNRGDHRRKFLKHSGRLIDASGETVDNDLVFWGEWEPDSRTVPVEARFPEGPRFIHEPFLALPPPAGWRQNTDPYVFGSTFHYTGCLQHTKHGPTQLRFLARGSVILFGSCLAEEKFVLDTLFVVDRFIDHTRDDFREAREAVSPTYAQATLDPWYSGSTPTSERSHRLYFGATQAEAVDGMFSFFPCLPAGQAPNGFPRPTIDLPEVITPTMKQGKRLNQQPDVGSVRALWNRVVAQVRARGLSLGVRADNPRTVRREDSPLEPSTRQGC